MGAGHDLAARHNGRVRCLAVVWRLPIGLKGASEVRLRLSGGRNQGTPGRRDLVDGNWTRLVSEARWTKSDESQMPCGRVAIGLKGASIQQRAAEFDRTREWQTRGRCDLDARTRAFTYDH